MSPMAVDMTIAMFSLLPEASSRYALWKLPLVCLTLTTVPSKGARFTCTLSGDMNMLNFRTSFLR
ncbi:hypothetical protein MBAV_001540 [Candidatus Magnetobacterium bavaricum]|uniref:Uncharacterized protein n=1 Tax=Candidatus Magnetobacterium bavaricum TaxID=29290 RepID=A0A0F3GWP6_9BACT|nr:hypothetical protein MBAV_001540 [Candidatus Magnetobacterium bavaricum]